MKEDIKKEDNENKKFGDQKGKNKSFFIAMGHALDGIIRAFKTERNLRIDYFIGLIVLILSLFFNFTKTEFACLCLTIGFVIFSEMINSTVEYIVDLITDKYDDRAKAAKDIAAGGVLISSTVAVVVAYFLFMDKLKYATTSVLTSILQSRSHMFFTIAFAIILLTVILKGIFGKHYKYSKAFPSARVTLAFGSTMYLYLMTKSLFVAGVALLLSVMICQLKNEEDKSNIYHLVFSAALGIIVVLAIYQLVLIGPDIVLFLNNLF